MNIELQKETRSRCNKAYLKRQKQKGIILRSFLVPRKIVDQVKDYIKEQSALLNNPQAKV